MSIDLEKKFTFIIDHPQLSFLKKVTLLLPEAEWFLVGGAVRDIILDRFNDYHDFDLVVRGVDLDKLAEILAELGRVDYVGRNFGVLKFRSTDSVEDSPSIDIAWPRTERAGGSGARRDFDVYANSELTIVDDLARRDFTINAMAWNFITAQLIDPFDGLQDLEMRLVRTVGKPEQRFVEDYSRLLRGIRFACELGFEIEKETWKSLCQLAAHIDDTRQEGERVVPYEILASEFLKALTANPVRSIDLFESSDILFLLIPELKRLQGLEQPLEWHSEGDVWQHTKLALKKAIGNEFAIMFPNEKISAETLIAVLLHDLGKADAIKIIDGRITFHGHDVGGAQLARQIVEHLRLSSVAKFAIKPERVEWLVRQHMFPALVDLDHVRKTTLMKYFLNDEQLGRQLLHLSFSDLAATIPESKLQDFSNFDRLQKELLVLKTKQEQEPEMLLTGDEILAITGLSPGPKIGRLLEELHEAQFSGELVTKEQAIELLRKKIHELEG